MPDYIWVEQSEPIYTRARGTRPPTGAGSRRRPVHACAEGPISPRPPSTTPGGHLAACPWPRTDYVFARAGLFLPRTTLTAVAPFALPVKSGAVPHGPRHRRLRRNTEGLISKRLFHRLYNSNSIASKTHEHKSVSVELQRHRLTNVANTRSSSRGPEQKSQNWHTWRKVDTFAPAFPRDGESSYAPILG